MSTLCSMTLPEGPPHNAPPGGRVLVVDDHETNRVLLTDLLTAGGHEVIQATGGAEALKLVQERQPDVVLLDVQMPGLSGMEVCRCLKADRGTAAIPVLMVTALSHREDRLAGIRAGANDFITKPIDNAEFLLRVNNAVQLRRLFTEVEEQYRKLEALESLRDDLVHMVAHDLRTPLTAVYTNLELLTDDVAPLGAEVAQTIADTVRGAQQVTDMVSDMLDVSRIEGGQFPLTIEAVDLAALTAETIQAIGARGAQVRYEFNARSVVARCDRAVIGRVLTNLLDNAIKYSDGLPVRVGIGYEGENVRITVQDTGPGVPLESRDTIFEKFGQVRGAAHQRRSTGLGLTFCKLAVEAHGGQIGLLSHPGNGSTFWFVVPARRQPA